MKLTKAQSRFIEANEDARRLFDRAHPGKDGCWLWQGARSDDGYGFMSFRARTWKAHRVAYTIFIGEIPDGLMVCHHCDNPSCINPTHLFLGHARANVMDMVRKGRGRNQITSSQDHFHAGRAPHGEDASGAKLTRETAEEIIRRAAKGAMTRPLAKEFGLARTTIQRILNGSTWPELERPSCLPRKTGRPAGRAALEERGDG